MVELDHSFSTGKPTDYNWEAILDLERVIPCVEGGTVVERTSPTSGQGRDQGQDGRDVDDVPGTVEVVEQRRRRPPRGAAGQVARGRRPGLRQRRRRVRR